MMRTAAQLTAEDLAPYRETAQRRSAEREARVAQRRTRAEALSSSAATLLRDQYGANKVVLFGSLIRPDRFNETSDIDLAAEGIHPRLFFQAVGALNDLTAEFEFDLTKG